MINIANIEKNGSGLFYEGADGNRHYNIYPDSDGGLMLTVSWLTEPDKFGERDLMTSRYACSALSTAIHTIEKIESGKGI